jgi:hypothetical protein
MSSPANAQIQQGVAPLYNQIQQQAQPAAGQSGTAPQMMQPNTQQQIGYGGNTFGQPAAAPAAPNIFDTAAGGINNAIQGATNSMGYDPQMISTGSLASTDMGQYMNPYISNVVDNTVNAANRQGDMMSNNLGAQASAAGAFGGDRHGIAQGTAYGDINRNLQQTVGDLYNTGYNQATGMAQQDISNDYNVQLANQNAGLAGSQQNLSAANTLGGLSNLGFGMGNTVNANLAADGGTVQGMNQAILDAANADYGSYMNHPSAGNAGYGASVGGVPFTSTATESGTPGLFDWLTLGASY